MNILGKIVDLLFPPSCPICGGATDGDELCEKCYGKFVRETFESCPICGRTASRCECGTDFTIHTKTVIGGKRLISMVFYNTKANQVESRVTEKLLFLLKDKGVLTKLVATELAREIKQLFEIAEVDLTEWIVTYPPRSAEKYREIGFDQGEEIARSLANLLRIKWEKTFVRAERGRVQKTLDGRTRKINAEESLIPIRANIRSGGKYIVFDDIITSGATMETVAKNLYFYGAAEVFPVCIARTENRKKTNKSE